jgi:hypothetical protein
MKLSILTAPRFRRCWAVLPMVLLIPVLGCRDDENGPTGPAEE